MLNHYYTLLETLKQSGLSQWAEQLPTQIAAGLNPQRYADLPHWQQALERLPTVTLKEIDLLNSVTIGTTKDISAHQSSALIKSLETLIPWRKGPFSLFGIDIDTEWRSDWKWERLLPYTAPFANKRVLDIGCSNGYHALRAYGAGASQVVGIEPSPRFVLQFLLLKYYLGQIPVDVLPIGIEQLPDHMAAFDITLSMGVLYHRRSPMDHLRELKATLAPGGQLILETLIIDGELGECLVPEGRYAMMRNVWFIPSAPTLISWLKKWGFNNPRIVDECNTSIEEQRATQWMRFQSLPDFLAPNDLSKTIEGHPAPRRGIFIAEN